MKVTTPKQVVRTFREKTAQAVVIDRKGNSLQLELEPASKLPVEFEAVEDDRVNAYATFGSITVTYGMLRFIRSEDELAVVLGHELAHILRDHLPKRMGAAIGSAVLGSVVAGSIDSVSPGAGSAVGQLLTETTNDHFLKTHPTSPERTLRLQKAAEAQAPSR